MNCSKTFVKYAIHQDVCENYLAYLSGYTTVFKDPNTRFTEMLDSPWQHEVKFPHHFPAEPLQMSTTLLPCRSHSHKQ